MRTAKEVKNVYKRAIKALVKLKADRAKLQAEYEQLKLAEGVSEGEINHVLSKIAFLNYDIKRLEDALKGKSKYFNVGINDLLAAIVIELKKKNPDDLVEWVVETKCEVAQKKSTQNIATKLCYGAVLVKAGKRLELPLIKVKDQKITATQFFMANKKVNLLKLGILEGECEAFKGEAFQKEFWLLVERNLQAELDVVRDQRGYSIKDAKKACADKINAIGDLRI